MSSKDPEVEVIENPRSGRRRRFTAEEKRALVEEAARPANSVSQVARRYSLSPSMVFMWRKLMEQGSMSSLTTVLLRRAVTMGRCTSMPSENPTVGHPHVVQIAALQQRI